MVEQPNTISRCLHLMVISKSLERIADHAVQMGRWVNFMVTGELPGYEPVTSVDETT